MDTELEIQYICGGSLGFHILKSFFLLSCLVEGDGFLYMVGLTFSLKAFCWKAVTNKILTFDLFHCGDIRFQNI